MSVNESPRPSGARYRTVFLVGCPRSGTTWLQQLLGQRPEIVTAPETQIFSYYLDHFRKQWELEHVGAAARAQGRTGLSRLLSEEEFLELTNTVARFVLDRIHAKRPSATIVLEKSPRHALLVEWILLALPEASVLHLIRDPRDTAVSLMKAARTWARTWAPVHPVDAARMWVDHVSSARRGKALPDRYHEVQYESLRARPIETYEEVLQWLGLETDPVGLQEAVSACEIEKLRDDDNSGPLSLPGAKTPNGFFGKGAVGGWRGELSRRHAKQIESICYDLMTSIGYEPVFVNRATRTVRARVHDGTQRVRESFDWQFQKLLRHL